MSVEKSVNQDGTHTVTESKNGKITFNQTFERYKDANKVYERLANGLPPFEEEK